MIPGKFLKCLMFQFVARGFRCNLVVKKILPGYIICSVSELSRQYYNQLKLINLRYKYDLITAVKNFLRGFIVAWLTFSILLLVNI